MWTGRSARWGWGRDSGRDSVVGRGADRGGVGGRLVWVWPVGVVMVTWPGRSGSGWWRQPSASLIWLQAAHRPWPLGRVVGPPAARPVTWSMRRIGASHQGVRQVWSRAVMKARAASENWRRLLSPSVRWPVIGSVYRLRIQVRVRGSSMTTWWRAIGSGIAP